MTPNAKRLDQMARIRRIAHDAKALLYEIGQVAAEVQEEIRAEEKKRQEDAVEAAYRREDWIDQYNSAMEDKRRHRR